MRSSEKKQSFGGQVDDREKAAEEEVLKIQKQITTPEVVNFSVIKYQNKNNSYINNKNNIFNEYCESNSPDTYALISDASPSMMRMIMNPSLIQISNNIDNQTIIDSDPLQLRSPMPA